MPPGVVILLAAVFSPVIQAAEASASTAPASLADVLPSLSPEDEMLLLGDGQVLRFHDRGVSPGLLPNTELTAAAARRIIGGDLNIGIEGLFFTELGELPAAYTALDRSERRLRLYNILRSVSTLQGLEYYSASRGKMRLLFEESWALADAGSSRDALDDPLVKSIPLEDSIMIHQRDKSFASNRSEMRFSARGEAFAAEIVNITPMRYKGLIRVADPGDMQTHLIVVPVREGILIYGTMAARTRDVRVFLDRARNSFTNRVIALTGWYRARLNQEFAGI